MDPLALIFSTKRQILFLARGDIFKNPKLVKIFTWLNMLPVYRERDGKDALPRNREIFQKSADAINNLIPFCLFPEAVHNKYRRLRVLKKGIPRIAFQAIEQSGFKSKIHIVPVGIYYDNKVDSRSILHIKYGKPILLNNYQENYQENPQKAMLSLKTDMAYKIKSLMIDIEDLENYHLYENLRDIYTPYLLKKIKLKSNQKNKFKVDQFVINNVAEKDQSKDGFLVEINEKVSSLNEKIKVSSISAFALVKNKSVFQAIFKILFILFSSPVYFISFLINYIPFQIPKYIIKNKIKDPQFISSIKFVSGGLLLPVYYVLLLGLSLLIGDYLFSLSLIILLPLSGFLSLVLNKLYRKYTTIIKFVFLSKAKKDDLLSSLSKLYSYLDSALPEYSENKDNDC